MYVYEECMLYGEMWVQIVRKHHFQLKEREIIYGKHALLEVTLN